jgi:hypothetical protein
MDSELAIWASRTEASIESVARRVSAAVGGLTFEARDSSYWGGDYLLARTSWGEVKVISNVVEDDGLGVIGEAPVDSTVVALTCSIPASSRILGALDADPHLDRIEK